MQLKPFSSSIDNLRLQAEAVQNGPRLIFRYSLEDADHIVQDSLKSGVWRNPERADELWRTTCFEAFWGIHGQKKYWELNLSPSREKWNCYVFSDYRIPQPPTPSDDFELLQAGCDGISLTCELQSANALLDLEMNLCAVIRLQDRIAYFSARHAPDKADFHWRGGFTRL